MKIELAAAQWKTVMGLEWRGARGTQMGLQTKDSEEGECQHVNSVTCNVHHAAG